MRRLVREPLIQFAVLGIAVFTVHEAVRSTNEATDAIVITGDRVETLVETFMRTHQRPPVQEELSQLLNDYVREEILYREGLALGLDIDDAVVRGRVAQKMEFFAESVVPTNEPDDAELQAFLDGHPEKFAIKAQYSFTQELVDPRKHGDQAPDRIKVLLASLRGDAVLPTTTSEGDPTLLDATYTNMTLDEVQVGFGAEFAAALKTMQLDKWEGPIESPFGLHAVKLDRLQPARAPALGEVRDAVRGEWLSARRQTTLLQYFEDLEKKYTVTLEITDDRRTAE